MDEIGEAVQLDEYAQRLHDYLYDRTAQSKVTARKALRLTPPDGIPKETMEQLLAGIGTEAAHPALAAVAIVQGRKDAYMYDKNIMTQHYAELDALLEDKDILSTIATVTRSDSKLYPRPTQFSKLMNVPFRFTRDEILGAAARMQQDEAYKDIGIVTASNGEEAFFSEKHMSRRYANSLLEAIEVEAHENP